MRVARQVPELARARQQTAKPRLARAAAAAAAHSLVRGCCGERKPLRRTSSRPDRNLRPQRREKEQKRQASPTRVRRRAVARRALGSAPCKHGHARPWRNRRLPRLAALHCVQVFEFVPCLESECYYILADEATGIEAGRVLFQPLYYGRVAAAHVLPRQAVLPRHIKK